MKITVKAEGGVGKTFAIERISEQLTQSFKHVAVWHRELAKEDCEIAEFIVDCPKR